MLPLESDHCNNPISSRKQSVNALWTQLTRSQGLTRTPPCVRVSVLGAESEVILADGKTVTVTKSQSARWACDEIVQRLAEILGEKIFLHFDKQKDTEESIQRQITVTGGSCYSLPLLKNYLFCATVVPYVMVEVDTTHNISINPALWKSHGWMKHFGTFLQIKGREPWSHGK